MWNFNYSIFEIILRTGLVYLIVLFGMRVTGKKEVGQMSPFDLVLFLLIANAVQNAMTGPDTSITGGITAAATLLVLNSIISWITWRFKRFGLFIEGSPTILIRQGKIIEANLKREKVNVAEVEQVLREHGIASIQDVAFAMLEIDGSISVLKKDELPVQPLPHHRIRFHREKT